MNLALNLVVKIVVSLWILAAICYYLPSKKQYLKTFAVIFSFSAIIFLCLYIVQLWMTLERPPLRTKGETRLLYATLVPLIALIIHLRLKTYWFAIYGQLMASVFLITNLIHPDYFDMTLMPALQSYWFVPHVIIYMIAYALLASTLMYAVRGFYLHKKGENLRFLLIRADVLVYLGFSLATFGITFGALWAKEAWGSYWAWDPKETWALVSWLCYLTYIHFRYRFPNKQYSALWFLIICFILLLIGWLGVDYMPSARQSMHSY
ncbi:MAG: cytochrome C assembly protein [Candidatus Cloacimonadota bacterium]|nr:MAG: cytochrome C assembly protein [Candidatus Cloacimonadota bacterium]